MKKLLLLPQFFLLSLLTFVFLSCTKDDAGTPLPNSVSIADNSFTSSSLTVAKGTKVIWTNNGATIHTVTSDDGASFDSGAIASGGTFSYTFNTTGTFGYHCQIHSGMTGTIIVSP